MNKIKACFFWIKNRELSQKTKEVKDLIIINGWLTGDQQVRGVWSVKDIVDMARPIESSWHWVQIGLKKDLQEYTYNAQEARIGVSLIEHLIGAYYVSNDRVNNHHSPADKKLLNALLLEKAEKFAGFGQYPVHSPYPGEDAKPLLASFTKERYFAATDRIMYYDLLTRPENKKDKNTLLKVIELEFKNHLKIVGNLDYILTFISKQHDPDNILINIFLKVSNARSYYKILSDYGRWTSQQDGSLDIPSHQMPSANLVHAANAYPQFASIIIEYVVKTEGVERLNHLYNVLLNRHYDMKPIPEIKSLIEKHTLQAQLEIPSIESKISNKI